MLLLLVPLMVVAPSAARAGQICGPPRFEGKMVFSTPAFHHALARSEIQCYDTCWSLLSCYTVSFNNITRQCRLFSQSDIANATFQDSVFEMYAVKKKPLCKPTRDPCSSHQCPDGKICITDRSTENSHVCDPLRYQPLVSCPVLEPSRGRFLTYIGNTPEGAARVTCRGTTVYTGSNRNLTCSKSATWEPDVGFCALYMWTDLPARWTGKIPRNTLVSGRCLEVHGSCPRKMWFTLNLVSTSSWSFVFHLTHRFGVWVRNSRLGKSSWGREEKYSLVAPFSHDKPINLTICFFEKKLKLFTKGRLFAEYQQRMNSGGIDEIQIADMDVIDKVIIRYIGNSILNST